MCTEDFKNVSIRARVAFSICCLEKMIKHYQLQHLDWSFILGLLWSYTDTNPGSWHENLTECIPNGVLKDSDELSDLEFLDENQFRELHETIFRK